MLIKPVCRPKNMLLAATSTPIPSPIATARIVSSGIAAGCIARPSASSREGVPFGNNQLNFNLNLYLSFERYFIYFNRLARYYSKFHLRCATGKRLGFKYKLRVICSSLHRVILSLSSVFALYISRPRFLRHSSFMAQNLRSADGILRVIRPADQPMLLLHSSYLL